LLFDLPTEYCLQADFVRGVRLLGDLGLSFDIEATATGLGAAAALVDRCPGTRFIIDHYGNPNLRHLDDDNWRTAMAELARRDNVAVKLSGVTTGLERGAWRSVDIAPATDHLLEVFGSERALYGSDWPVVKINSSLQGWYEAMVAMVGAYSEAEQRRIFCDNAVVWYGL
jgi:predicted TIM-barrel fold metal-dependent hydrolase